jgi:outer membrane protein assembly factor BamB
MPPAASDGSVLQYHADAKRSGLYVDPAFTRAAAAMIKKDTSFSAMVNGQIYAQPLYFAGGPGGKDVLIVATEQNEVSALDATTGAMVWKQTLAAPVTGGLPCGNIMPLGVTGTPVIDAASRTVYVAAMTQGPKHQVFALSIDDGSPRMGFPIDLSTVKAGSVPFDSSVQNQRGALLILNDTLYIPYGGHFGDCGAYHGWVIGVPLKTSGIPTAFATQSNGAGIWTPGGLASDGTSVFAATGNGMADGGGLFTSPAMWGGGNAILRLTPDLNPIQQSATKDFFAAQTWAQFDQGDLDVGGSAPILFDAPGSTPSSLAMALGKSGDAYLLSVENLGGMGGMLATAKVASGGTGGGMIQAATAYTTPTGTFVVFRAVQQVMGCGSGMGYVGAFQINAGSPPTMKVAWCASPNGTGSPIATSTDGTAESIVWIVAGGKLLGYNGENGMPVYSGTAGEAGMPAKFQTPIVAKGRMFFASGSSVIAFTLK